MTIYKPTYLYVKKHSITGLLYFGKTVKDPSTYLGSGTYWNRHIIKHGVEHVITLWSQLYTNKVELELDAVNFSVTHNIVDSKCWANLMVETGNSGGAVFNNNFKTWNKIPKTDEYKRKISNIKKGKAYKKYPILINGKKYESTSEAARVLKCSNGKIEYMIKKGKAERLLYEPKTIMVNGRRVKNKSHDN